MRRFIAITGSIAVAAAIGLTVPAQAAENYKPRKSACTADPSNYACLRTDTRKEIAGEPVTFRGSLSKQAQRNLAKYTNGENTICLTRYESKPEKDGAWPWQTLDEACTTLNTDGTFGLIAYLGRQGKYFYGVEMGPCRAGEAECEGGDPGLLGVSNRNNRVVAVRTVAP